VNCTNCGSPIGTDEKFCGQCGMPSPRGLAPEPAPVRAPVHPPDETPRLPSSSDRAFVDVEGRRRRWIYIVLVALLFIVAATLGWIVRIRLGSARDYVWGLTIEYARDGDWEMVWVSIRHAFSSVGWALKSIFSG
jgi:hypothetical protein